MNNRGILEHMTQYTEICLKRKARCIRSRPLYKNTEIPVSFFLKKPNTGYLHVIHSFHQLVLKVIPKDKQRTFIYVYISKQVCVFCPNTNDSINIISKSPGFTPTSPAKKKEALKSAENNILNVNQLLRLLFSFFPNQNDVNPKTFQKCFLNF